MNKSTMLPYNLQFFAEDGSEPNGQNGNQQQSNQQANEQNGGQQSGGQSQQSIDYDKIQQMLNGTLAAKEETALKAYFRQQGLSQQEVEQAIASFKEQKAANQPDVNAMQTALDKANDAMKQAQIQSEATMAAVSLGIDAKTIPYVLKMAYLSQAVGQDGKINTETIKNALNKVMEDVPALKPQQAGASGFIQVGASGGSGGAGAVDNELDRIFGVKK